MRIKSGDTVVVISGKDKGKKGKVLEVITSKDKVLVEGVNVATKHQKPNTTFASVQEMPRNAQNVSLLPRFWKSHRHVLQMQSVKHSYLSKLPALVRRLRL